MTNEELEARFKELEEHMQASVTISSAVNAELVAALAGALIRDRICSPARIMEYLNVFLEDAKIADQDSDEAKMGKTLLAQSIGLLRLRLSNIQAAHEVGHNRPTLQ